MCPAWPTRSSSCATSAASPRSPRSTAEDLFRAQGFVHAQDRFFEMDYRRHVTAGRLSELVGDNRARARGGPRDPHLRLAPRRRAGVGPARGHDAQPPARPTRTASTPTSAAAAPQSLAVEYTVLGAQVDVTDARAVGPGRLARVAQGDGLGPARQLRRGARPGDRASPPCRTSPASPSCSRPTRRTSTRRSCPRTPPTGADASADVRRRTDPGATRRSGTPARRGPGAYPPSPDLAAQDLQRALSLGPDALAAVPHLVGEGEGIGSNSGSWAAQHTETGVPILANDPHLTSRRPASGPRWGCAARRSRPSARSTSPGSPSPASRA